MKVSRLVDTGISIHKHQKLQRLNLNFNPLGDGASYPLTSCLHHMSALKSLQIESCGLTDRFFDDYVAPSIKQIKTEDIGIGLNDFSPSSIKSWFEVLDFTTLKCLSLKGLTTDRLMSFLCRSIESIDECQLVEINLSHCNLTDSCIAQFALSLHHAPNLRRLVLRNNIKLGIDALADILSCCRIKGVQLEELDLLGCALSRSNTQDNSRCAESLRSLLISSKSLQRLSLSLSRHNSDPIWTSSLSDVWITAHDRGLARQPTEFQLILTTSTS